MKNLCGVLACASALFINSTTQAATPGLPTPVDGVVTLDESTTYTLTEADDLSALTAIKVPQGATLIYDISDGATLVVPCAVNGKGQVVKNGAGEVSYTYTATTKSTTDYYIQYPGATTINAGTLKLPNYKNTASGSDAYAYNGVYFGRMIVNAPGILDIAVDTQTAVEGLWGDGTVTATDTTSSNDQLMIIGDKGTGTDPKQAPSVFSGKITGRVRHRHAYGAMNLTGVVSDNTGDTALGNADLGVMKFGAVKGVGSLGVNPVTVRSTPLTLRYLGTGENTTKSIVFGSGSAAITLDGGATGNLDFSSSGAIQNYAGKAATLTLTGDHTNSCAISGGFTEGSGTISLTKSGKGIWKLAGEKALTGTVVVKDGTLALEGDHSGEKHNFTWFKLIIRGVYGASEANAAIEEIAFYDKNNVRVTDGFSIVRNEGSGYVPFSDLSNLQPGQYGWLPNGTATSYTYYGSASYGGTERDANNSFDGVLSAYANIVAYNGTGSPKPAKSSTWHILLIRMPEGAPAVASFDILNSNQAATADRAMTDWTMMGSEDGITWYTVKTYDDPGAENRPGAKCWYSNNQVTTYSWYNATKKTTDNHEGFPANVVETGTTIVNPLKNAASLEVTGGTLELAGALDIAAVTMGAATLKVEGGNKSTVETLNLSGDVAINLVDGAPLTIGAFGTWTSGAKVAITCADASQITLPTLTTTQKTAISINGKPLAGEDRTRIAFFGDSITHGGFWEYLIQYMETLRHPEDGVRTLNCGISGDTAAGGLKRLQRDVLARNVDSVVMMFGMNDVGRNYYGPNLASTESQRAAAIAACATNEAAIIDQLLAAGKKVTIVTPTPYDEYGTYEGAQDNYVGVNTLGLTAIAANVRALAAEKGISLIDFHQPMTAIYSSLSNETAKAKRFNRVDRIHPELVGHTLMTVLYWTQLGYGAEPYSDQTFTASGDSFLVSYTPSGLPLPKNEYFARVAEVLPEETKAMNRELVKITGLDAGDYLLLAEGAYLGSYTAEELAAGIDLADLDTPSQAQSVQGFQKMTQLEANELALRAIMMMEIQAQKVEPTIDLADYAAVSNRLVTWIQTVTSNHDYYLSMVNSYIKNKPNQQTIEERSTELVKELRQIDTPQAYNLCVQGRKGIVIEANQGLVEKTANELAAAPSITIGSGSTLLLRNLGSAGASVDISADLAGAGGLYITNAYVNLSGDNSNFTGTKAFTNAFVTISGRYGLGSPKVWLTSHITTTSTGYLHFTGNGLTNDVSIIVTGGGYGVTSPAAALTADRHEKLLQNGAISNPYTATFRFGDYTFAGGFSRSVSAWNIGYSDCETWITGPFTTTSKGTYFVIGGPKTVHIAPSSESTAWPYYLYIRDASTVVCEGQNVWGTSNWLALGAHKSSTAGNENTVGTFDLNGYDQTFAKLAFYGEHSVQQTWTNLNLVVKSTVPATLKVTSGSKSREGIRFQGAVNLNLATNEAWTNVLFQSTSTGTLTVAKGGEAFFDWGAGWQGNIVLNGGTFGCDSAAGVSSATVVTITDGGKLIVPEGVTLTVASVELDGKVLSAGTYAGTDWIVGAGQVTTLSGPTSKPGMLLLLK